MQYEIKENGKFKFIQEGHGEPLILLHGLFGTMSNYTYIVNHFKDTYNVIVPLLPLYELDIFHTSVNGLATHVQKFIDAQQYENIHLLGNSLGGHVGLVYALKHPEKIKSLILTGSSGLYEHGMGDTYPKRGDYDFIKDKTEKTFYDPATATKELVDEVFDIVNSRIKAIKIIALAKSAIRNNIGDQLHNLKMPTLLIWGNQDIITPPFVGEEFKKLIPHSELKFIDKCGHAPMMENPELFNEYLDAFLEKLKIAN